MEYKKRVDDEVDCFQQAAGFMSMRSSLILADPSQHFR